MRMLTKLTCIMVTVLALGGERSAAAQSAPAASGSAAPGGLSLPSGAGAPIQSNAGGADLQMLHGDAPGATSTTAGRATQVPLDDLQGGGVTAVRSSRTDAVVRGQINPAARSCYESDPDSKSRQPGKLVILIKLTPTGEIDSVTAANSIGLSASVVSCITAAARLARFAPPGARGATVRAAFAFPRQDDRPVLSAAGGKSAQPASASGPAARDTVAKADPPQANGQTAHR